MENHLLWKDEYNIGVDIIDKEHQRLFKILNKLFRFGGEKNKSQWACQEGIKFFKDHAMKHFADEEEYMEFINYEDLDTHKRIHQEFREKTLPILEKELEQTDYSENAVEHFLGVCAGWLMGHTLTEDHAITGGSVSRWRELLPGKELESIKKIIIRLIYDMFHLESHIISETYGGEKFGRGVYYRLVYGTEQEEEKCEILLVFEERLLINTVGKAMGIKTNKLDTMLMTSARYTSRQFVGRIIEHLPDMDGYELKEENLLTYEQFRKVFETKQLQVSLLFDTGEGYFSYCALAPRLLKKGSATPINIKNAMTEVEEYLRKREEPAKPKVLVVDDSMTVRQMIKDLLDERYDVALASSGTAAIRCLSLDRPDLVLLDYEMPICNGKQVLEMIRSEDSFAGIPVFFLTGRTDPETVKTLISLKPNGYLAKYLKPEEIQTKIDAFFDQKNSRQEIKS